MAHPRQLIRDNIVTTLTSLTTTGTNVFRSRVYPLTADRMPGLAIYTRDEVSEYTTIGPSRTVLRTVTVTVEVYVAANADYDTTIDTSCEEVENALAVDRTRGGLALDTRVVSLNVDFAGESETPVARATVQIEVDYVTIEGSA